MFRERKVERMNDTMHDEWWVYENWTVVAGGKTIVHHGDCHFCNHGRGIHNNVSNRNDKWHGHYPSMDAAMTKAISLGRTDTRLCAYCERKYVTFKR